MKTAENAQAEALRGLADSSYMRCPFCGCKSRATHKADCIIELAAVALEQAVRPEENATKTCVGCGSSWTAPVSYCPQCGPTAKDRIAAVKADQAGEPISAKDAAYALCRAIEALPGSPQQTALSIKASELLLSLGNSSPHSHGSQRAMVMSPDGLRVVDNVSLPSPRGTPAA